MTTKISLFSNVRHTRDAKDIPIDLFFDSIANGRWQDLVLPIRAMTNEAERENAKKNVPLVTLSGVFPERKDDQLKQHSQLIGIDVDDLDNPEQDKERLKGDKHVYAAFKSIGGKGLCLVFKINGDKHRELYAGISEYLGKNYQLVADPKCVNVSRARFISFDPHIYVNENAAKFTYVPKTKPIKNVPNVVFVNSDFDLIIQTIVERRIDLTDDYGDWLRIGFALADKFGENGRGYFHQVSQFNGDYNSRFCDRQYNSCLRAGRSGVTIATFYYMAKQAGIETVSEKTKLIAQTAYHAKKGRRTVEGTVKLLQEIENISEVESVDIINQVFDNNIEVRGESDVEELETWLRQNYTLKYNEVFKKIEIDGKIMDDRLFNSLFIAAKKIFDKSVTKDLLDALIDSSFTVSYNPLHEFFERYKDRKPVGVIDKFFGCISTDTGLSEGNFCPQYTTYFAKKWLVSVIASAYGEISNLMLVFTGPQNSGKTRFARSLMPKELLPYYAECKFENGKDDEILMTTRLVIFDDEMSGKTHKEEKRMKHRLDKDVITVRKPFKRFDVDLKRIAVFMASTNDLEVLHDPTGNRRYLPVNVLGIDFEKLSLIDRVDLFIEAYHLYQDGFEWRLSVEDIKMLRDNNREFESTSVEYDMLNKYFLHVDDDAKDGNLLTLADIKQYLENRSVLKMQEYQLKREIKRLKWVSRSTRVNGRAGRYYKLTELNPYSL